MGELESVWCNWCGKRLIVKDGILREGSAHFELTWDYFSEKDGEVHSFDLCESCYDELTNQFKNFCSGKRADGTFVESKLQDRKKFFFVI